MSATIDDRCKKGRGQTGRQAERGVVAVVVAVFVALGRAGEPSGVLCKVNRGKKERTTERDNFLTTQRKHDPVQVLPEHGF